MPVSPTDKGQSPENQLAELRQWCKQSGHDVIELLVIQSAKKQV